jgi:hypothetical protein
VFTNFWFIELIDVMLSQLQQTAEFLRPFRQPVLADRVWLDRMALDD